MNRLKNSLSTKLTVFLFAVVLLAGCNKSLDINTDPNRSLTSRVDLQLTSSQLYFGNGIGDRLYSQLNVWNQYWTGGPGVSLGDWDKNTMATSDGNQVWQNLYRSMSNLDYIVKKGSANDSLYIAIAKLLKGYNTSIAVDLFGDVPFTDALKGGLNDGFIVSPKYDNAETVVYPGIETEIQEALEILNTYIAEPVASWTVPASDDLIYGGDLEKWTAFGNSLLLKLYIREGSDAAKDKFAALYASFEGSTTAYISIADDIAKIPYFGGPQGSNPYWTDASSALGNFYVGSKTTIDYLENTDDPRINDFYDVSTTGAHLGMKQGDVENWSPPTAFSTPSGAADGDGGKVFNSTAPVILISSWEMDLILAEAAAKGWIADDAEALYKAAVTESFGYLETDGSADTYVAGGGKMDNTSTASKLKSIALQKWVCMNGLQPIESWIETRRTDNASNPIFASPGGLFEVPTQNILGGSLHPSILYYAQTEQDLNKSFPGQHKLTDRVFWDK